MNRDDIIRMAGEAGFDAHDMSDDFTCNLRDIERFATLVATAEREACAALLDANAKNCHEGSITYSVLKANAAAIRARGNK